MRRGVVEGTGVGPRAAPLPSRWAVVAGGVLLGVVLAVTGRHALAEGFYDLEPVEVADGVYAFEGRLEHFTRENAGNIVNTGFIVTAAGVIVIDTGSSYLYGVAMREAIAEVTAQPVVAAYITHHHPDHYLGNEAFSEASISALPHTMEAIEREGDDVTDALYRSVGDAMRGTEPVVPEHEAMPGVYEHAGRELEMIAVGGHSGHEEADLMILDRTSGVLFAGDVVFVDRAPTTPHADVPRWIAELEKLEERVETEEIQAVIPGHGPLERGMEGIAQTREYLEWLLQRLEQGADEGLHPAELMARPIPEPFAALAVIDEEYPRSVAHLYPSLLAERLERLEGE